MSRSGSKKDKWFHGTSRKRLSSILKDGLRVSAPRIWSCSEPGRIYVTRDFERALSFAEIAARYDRSQPVVLKVDAEVTPDIWLDGVVTEDIGPEHIVVVGEW